MAGTMAIRQFEPAGAAIQPASGRRFYDAVNGCWIVKVFPGEYYVTNRPDESVVTVLGSCVTACIRDPVAGVGGMNHFMLPYSELGTWGDTARSTRFGNFAMEKLINGLIKAGCARERMEIKVFGGANVTETGNEVGTDNSTFVLRYLASEGLCCAVRDLGGTLPRRLHYDPMTGRVVRRLLGLGEAPAVRREEDGFASRLVAQAPCGDIELFGE